MGGREGGRREGNEHVRKGRQKEGDEGMEGEVTEWQGKDTQEDLL